jgi:hypothetical protein
VNCDQLTIFSTYYINFSTSLQSSNIEGVCLIPERKSRGIQKQSLPNCLRANHLEYTAVDNGGVSFSGTGLGTDSLNGSNNLVGFNVTRDDFTKDNVLAIEPASDNCSDEEL